MGSWRGSTVRDEGCGAERGQVGLERIVVFVAHRHGENAGEGALMNGSTKAPGISSTTALK